jgi:DNA replication protein DnaC
MDKLYNNTMKYDDLYDKKLEQQLKFINKDEHIVDNMIYCKNCDTQRLWISPNKQIVTRVLCECQSEELEREEIDKELEKVKAYSKLLKDRSKLGKRFYNVTLGKSKETADKLSDSLKTAHEGAETYVNNWDSNLKQGKGFYYWGENGVGKTHLVAGLCNFLIDKYYAKVLFTSTGDILKEIRASFDNPNKTEQQVFNFYVSLDLLVIDDIGKQRFKLKGEDTHAQEKLIEIVEARYKDKKPTGLTSNHSLRQLVDEKGLDKAVAGRIYECSKDFTLEIKSPNIRIMTDEEKWWQKD